MAQAEETKRRIRGDDMDTSRTMNRLLYALTAALVFVGFITNACMMLPVNFGTVVVDLCYVLVLALAGWTAFVGKNALVLRPRSLLILYGLLAVWTAVLVCLPYGTPYERVMGFRNYAVYPSVFLVIMTSSQRLNARKIMDVLWWSGLAVCAFAIVQSFAFRSLPPLLLSLGGNEIMFDINDGEIFRVNGLVGTTIVFSTFAVLILFCGIFREARWQKALSVIPAAALYLSYSRIAMLGFLGVCALALLWKVLFRLPRDLCWAALALLALAVSSASPKMVEFARDRIDREAVQDAHFAKAGEGAIANRLLGRDKITRKSTVAHIEQYQKGLTAIAANPLTGVGLGTQGCSSRENGRYSLVQDGFYLATALELGVVGFALYMSLFIGVLGFAFWRWSRSPTQVAVNPCVTVFLFWGVFLLVCNLVNSSFASRINQCLFWILAGLSVACCRQFASCSELGGDTIHRATK